ncbi:class V chitinase-like [Argentina anserina]|uniref:class V chitinase-like n=1 Tax=Argentina anserina TaxID=57926 RepID=UPI0021768C12|nr:class V chitinase-like [Potentilla anserina]
MSYDYYGPCYAEGKTKTYPPAALYNGGSTSLINGDAGIVSWINKAGISIKKIVIGLPLGCMESEAGTWKQSGYNQIRDLISHGFQTVYNATVVSNYCYSGTTWIGYDGMQSISAKVSYAKRKFF